MSLKRACVSVQCDSDSSSEIEVLDVKTPQENYISSSCPEQPLKKKFKIGNGQEDDSEVEVLHVEEGHVRRAVEIVMVEKPKIFSPPLEIIEVISPPKKERQMPSSLGDIRNVQVTAGSSKDNLPGTSANVRKFILKPKIIDGGFVSDSGEDNKLPDIEEDTDEPKAQKPIDLSAKVKKGGESKIMANKEQIGEEEKDDFEKPERCDREKDKEKGKEDGRQIEEQDELDETRAYSDDNSPDLKLQLSDGNNDEELGPLFQNQLMDPENNAAYMAVMWDESD